MKNKKVLVSLSGGMDSSTMVGHLIVNGGYSVSCVNFTYGSKHNQYEIESARNINSYYKLPKLIELDLSDIFKNIKSNLLLSGGEIPEGHYNDESMKLTVVPGRNTIFSSIMYGIAESLGFDYIALGVHKGDHFIYPDCREEYITSLRKTIELASDGKVSVLTPFINDDKYGILKVGQMIDVPYHLTRTCYKNQKFSCGVCGSCSERLEAFQKIGIIDPIVYESNNSVKKFEIYFKDIIPETQEKISEHFNINVNSQNDFNESPIFSIIQYG